MSVLTLLSRAVGNGANALSAVSRLFPVRSRSTSYGPHARNGMDIYEPRSGSVHPCSILFFYGGNWVTGSREEYRFAGAALAHRGYRVFLPDYRLQPEATYPEIVADGSAALSKALTLEPSRPIVVVGHSAGGGIAVSLAVQRPYDVAGVIGLSAPFRDAVDTTRGPLPPALFIAARDDRVVSVANSEHLRSAWSRRGPAQVRLFDSGGHALVVGALSPALSWRLPVLAEIDRFVASLPVTEPVA